MIALAIDSGIAPEAWWREDDKTIMTALDIMHEARKGNGRKQAPEDEGVVTSG